MEQRSTARFAPVFRSTWLALSLVLGCAGAEAETEMEMEMESGPVMGGSPADAAPVRGPALDGSAPVEGSAAEGGGRAVVAGAKAVASADPNGPSGAAGASSAAGSGAIAGTSVPSAGSGGMAGVSSAGSSGGESSAGAGGVAMQAGAAGSGTPSDAPLTIYIASDSTASSYKDTGSDKDQAGWGQMLPEFVKPNAKVDNRAIGGRTARRFIDEGTLDKIWADIKAGDYLLVQFGTNDGNKNATYELNGQQIPYYLDPQTDFKTYIKEYIEGAHEHGAVPVLVTPPPRNSAYCTGGNGTGAHAQALRELGESEQVLVVDLNQKTVDYLKAICPEPSTPDFFLQKPDGSVDGTHFQKRGARKLASFVAEGLRAHMLPWIED